MEAPDFDKILVNLTNAFNEMASIEDLRTSLKIAKEQRDEFQERYSDLLRQSLSWATQQLELEDLKVKYNSLLEEHEVVKQKIADLEKEKQNCSKEIEELKAYSENKDEELFMHMQCEIQIKEKEYDDSIRNLKEKLNQQLTNDEEHYKELLNDRNEKLRQALASNTHLKSELMTIHENNRFDEFIAQTMRSDEEKRLKEQLRYAQTQINQLEQDLQQVSADNLRENLVTTSAAPSVDEALDLNINKLDEEDRYELQDYDNLPQLKTLNCSTRTNHPPVPVPKRRRFCYKRQRRVQNRSGGNENLTNSARISSTTNCISQPSTSSAVPVDSNNKNRRSPIRRRKLLSDTLLNLFSQSDDED